jgi:HEAT repeat protein
MVQLPNKPSLEHLKSQAKHLLKAYRADDAETLQRIQTQLKKFSPSSRFLLADAQLVIAKEYGFSSWSKLKHCVEAARTKKSNVSARKIFIRDLVHQVLAWSQHHDIEKLGQRFAVMPLRDILAVREVVVANGQHSVLVDGLLEGLKHSEARVRYNCAGALDHLADERCTEPLRLLLNDPVARVRRAALHSLSCDACKVSPLPNRDELTDKIIEMALNDSSIRARRVAADSLAQSCDPRAMGILKTLLEENDTLLQRTARIALKHQQT